MGLLNGTLARDGCCPYCDLQLAFGVLAYIGCCMGWSFSGYATPADGGIEATSLVHPRATGTFGLVPWCIEANGCRWFIPWWNIAIWLFGLYAWAILTILLTLLEYGWKLLLCCWRQQLWNNTVVSSLQWQLRIFVGGRTPVKIEIIQPWGVYLNSNRNGISAGRRNILLPTVILLTLFQRIDKYCTRKKVVGLGTVPTHLLVLYIPTDSQ